MPVLLAETDLLYVAGIADVVRHAPDLAWRGSVRSQTDLDAALETADPTIAVISASLVRDIDHLVQVAHARSHRLVLSLQRSQEPPWTHLPHAHGVLFSDVDENTLLACLRTVAAGSQWAPPGTGLKRQPNTPGERVLAQLTPRQILVLTEVARGEKNADIAKRLGTTEQVVKNMLRNIYDLTGVSDRLELALYVLHHPELALQAGIAPA